MKEAWSYSSFYCSLTRRTKRCTQLFIVDEFFDVSRTITASLRNKNWNSPGSSKKLTRVCRSFVLASPNKEGNGQRDQPQSWIYMVGWKGRARWKGTGLLRLFGDAFPFVCRTEACQSGNDLGLLYDYAACTSKRVKIIKFFHFLMVPSEHRTDPISDALETTN